MNFHNLSIKRKLTLITMLTSSAALVLSALSFLVYDLVSFRHLLIQDLRTQAEIIGYNSAGAMEFKDITSATATLTALTAKEDIVAAVLYNLEGKEFAHYSRNNDAFPKVLLPCHKIRDIDSTADTCKCSTMSPWTANILEYSFCNPTCGNGVCEPNGTAEFFAFLYWSPAPSRCSSPPNYSG